MNANMGSENSHNYEWEPPGENKRESRWRVRGVQSGRRVTRPYPGKERYGVSRNSRCSSPMVTRRQEMWRNVCKRQGGQGRGRADQGDPRWMRKEHYADSLKRWQLIGEFWRRRGATPLNKSKSPGLYSCEGAFLCVESGIKHRSATRQQAGELKETEKVVLW
jgi:hypothetical protein